MRSISKTALLLVLFGTGCEALPDIEEGECGNGVLEVDRGEDCDGQGQASGFECIGGNEANGCHYRCNVVGEGPDTTYECPYGYACGVLDNVCRAPKGQFDRPDALVLSSARRLLAADFDLNGLPDVVGVGPRAISVHYLDEGASWSSSFDIPGAPTIPVITKMPGDEHPDLCAEVDLGLSVLRGRSGRSLDPTLFPNLTEDGLLQVSVVDGLPSAGDELIVAIRNEQTSQQIQIHGWAINGSSEPTRLITLPSSGFEGLEGPVASAKLGTVAACDTVFAAFTGRPDVQYFTPCDGLDWASNPTVNDIPLAAGRTTWQGIWLADLDGDGATELLAGSRGGNPENYRVEVFHYDGALGGFAPAGFLPVGDAATVCTKTGPGDGELTGPPLAIGDLNGDGHAEIIDQGGILSLLPQGGPLRAFCSPPLWSAAYIGAVNLDPYLDLAFVPIGSSSLQLLLGAPDGTLNSASFPTDAPVVQIIAGDVDGDIVNDLVLLQRGSPEEGGELVSVLFGQALGAPEPPVSIGRLGKIETLQVGRTVGADGIDDINIFYGQGDSTEMSFSMLAGNTSRQLQSPFLFVRNTDQFQVPVVITGGQFALDDEGTIEIAAMTRTPGDFGTYGDQGGLSLASPSGPSAITSVELEAISSYAGVLGGGMAMAAVDTDGDGDDELVIFGRTEGGADHLYVGPKADGSKILTAGQEITDLPSPLRLARVDDPYGVPIRAVDIDGNGPRDIALITEAGELVIFWNSPGITAADRSVITLPGVADAAGSGPAIRDLDFLEIEKQPELERLGGALLQEVAYITRHGLRAARLTPLGQLRPQAAEEIGLVSGWVSGENEPLVPDGEALLAVDADSDGITDLAIGSDNGIFLMLASRNPR